MTYPQLIIFKTRHCNYNFLANNKTQYQKIGLKILVLMQENHWLYEDKTSQKTLEEHLEEKFDLPFDKIKEIYKSDLNKDMVLNGKKSPVYESGYETPRGKNVIEQVNLVKRDYTMSKEHNKYFNKALDVISRKEHKEAWSIVEFFGVDSIDRESFDSSEIPS